MRFQNRQHRYWNRKGQNVRSTISNAACRRNGLARCSWVSEVGWRGLPVPSPSAVQPGGIYRQRWISCLPMRPSAADLPRSSWPTGTAGPPGSHWDDRSRWKGRCRGTGRACRCDRHRRADGPLWICGAERTYGTRWRARTNRLDWADGTQRRYRRDWIRRTARSNGTHRHHWSTGVHWTCRRHGICGPNRAAGHRRI